MVFGDRYWKFEFTRSRFTNTLPNHQIVCIPYNRPTPAIEPEILRTMVVRHFIGYAPNPGTRKRNQVFYCAHIVFCFALFFNTMKIVEFVGNVLVITMLGNARDETNLKY